MFRELFRRFPGPVPRELQKFRPAQRDFPAQLPDGHFARLFRRGKHQADAATIEKAQIAGLKQKLQA